MYSWGGSTGDWKKPGGYDFKSARKPYLDKLAADADARGGRHYVSSNTANMKLVDPSGKVITSTSENPIVVGVDVTGSMASWPEEIFDRLPLLYQTLSQYRPDIEICFAAIGDAFVDGYPLQVNNFGKGVTLEDHLNALYPEGGGGGQVSESYEMFVYFMLEHCKIPNAKSPFLFIYGDEKFYDKVNPAQVRHYIGDDLQNEVESAKVFEGILQKFNTFYLQKPYGSSFDETTTKEVTQHWADALGRQRIIHLPGFERAVDVAMAIVARYWGQYGDFTKNISARQDSSQLALVNKSIRYLPNDPDAPQTRASRLLRSGKGTVTKRLDG